MFCSIEYDIGTSNQFDSEIKKKTSQQIFLCLKRILLSLGLVSSNLMCVMDAFFKKEFLYDFKKKNQTASIKKWRDDPEIPKKLG